MASIHPNVMIELASWLDGMAEAQYSRDELLDSLDHKLRTLGGRPPRRTDQYPVALGTYAELRAALMASDRPARRSFFGDGSVVGLDGEPIPPGE
jgi:hypothetical protein